MLEGKGSTLFNKLLSDITLIKPAATVLKNNLVDPMHSRI